MGTYVANVKFIYWGRVKFCLKLLDIFEIQFYHIIYRKYRPKIKDIKFKGRTSIKATGGVGS